MLIVLAGVGAVVVVNNVKNAKSKNQKTFVSVEQADSYWTCPMHPEIHQDHPGECPICHMKLVKVTKAKSGKSSQESIESTRAIITANSAQLQAAGIQKYKVEKMNLKIRIPISGRLISSSSVAFQVYEKDLQYVRSGLSFSGESSDYAHEISGVIAAVDSIVDPSSRTLRVVGTIKKGPARLISETSFRGNIEIDLKGAVAIPESAVLHTGAGDLAYLITADGQLVAKKIKLGQKSEGYYEVISGLSVGDTISSGPNFLIDSEAKIRGAND